jgi:hypothetical protein
LANMSWGNPISMRLIGLRCRAPITPQPVSIREGGPACPCVHGVLRHAQTLTSATPHGQRAAHFGAAVGRRFAESMRLARLAQTLSAITWPQTVGSLERQHPPWILRGKSADLIQLPKLVLGECEFDRREIVLKLVEAFRANDGRGYHRLC